MLTVAIATATPLVEYSIQGLKFCPFFGMSTHKFNTTNAFKVSLSVSVHHYPHFIISYPRSTAAGFLSFAPTLSVAVQKQP